MPFLLTILEVSIMPVLFHFIHVIPNIFLWLNNLNAIKVYNLLFGFQI